MRKWAYEICSSFVFDKAVSFMLRRTFSFVTVFSLKCCYRTCYCYYSWNCLLIRVNMSGQCELQWLTGAVLYCCFQPLKINIPNEIVDKIDVSLSRGDGDDLLRGIFLDARNYVTAHEISEQLADFRAKRALGESALLIQLSSCDK